MWNIYSVFEPTKIAFRSCNAIGFWFIRFFIGLAAIRLSESGGIFPPIRCIYIMFHKLRLNLVFVQRCRLPSFQTECLYQQMIWKTKLWRNANKLGS